MERKREREIVHLIRILVWVYIIKERFSTQACLVAIGADV